MELSPIEAIKNAVQSGLGAAFVSSSAIAKELQRVIPVRPSRALLVAHGRYGCQPNRVTARRRHTL